MPLRRTLAALAAAVLLSAATARAAEVRPGEVVVGATHHDPAPRVVRLPPGTDVHHAARRLARRPGVAYAVPNVVARAAAQTVAPFVPNDPGRGTTAGGWAQVQWNFVGPWSVNVLPAWLRAAQAGRPGGAGVRIAVLDTGVAYKDRGRFRRSPDLVGTRFMRGYDFVDEDPYPEDHNGHGTHVASTIAEATNNGVALTGLAYGASIMPVRVLDTQGEGAASAIARGVRFAARRGADIINLSLEFSTDVTARDIPQLISALKYARDRGALIVGASGNEARRAIAYPARARSVLSVGATTEHGCLSDFSNDGQGLDLVAPGGGSDASLADDPNCRPFDPPGRDIIQMTFLGSNPRRFGMPAGYEGTSMAVPHVTGVAALVIASGVLGPDPTAAAVEEHLKATARDLGAPGYDTRYGAGLIDADRATAPPAPPGTPAPPPAAAPTSSG